MSDYDQNMAEMKADKPFMEWLEQYDPEWQCEYSGNIFALREAFNAGRDAQRAEGAGDCDPQS